MIVEDRTLIYSERGASIWGDSGPAEKRFSAAGGPAAIFVPMGLRTTVLF